MDKYKSWNSLNKQLNNCLCDELKDSISYFFTRYHKVHNSYGRASIKYNNNELIIFSWVDAYTQEFQINKLYNENKNDTYDELCNKLKPCWDINCTYGENDFLHSVLLFRNYSIIDALNSDNYIIKILAILDRRVGNRTLKKIKEENVYLTYPEWVKQFYNIRFQTCGIE